MKNIAILAGGDSSESIISLESAKEVEQLLDAQKYNIYKISVKSADWRLISFNGKALDIPINKDDFSCLVEGETVKFHYALIMIHGTPGEDGKMQSYFEMLSVPYSTCDSFVSALTFNKFACKMYLKAFDIPMAHSILVRAKNDYPPAEIIKQLGLPCFVKPNTGGSSFGVSKVKKESELLEAIDLALKESPEVIIEAFIEGTEVSNGIFKGKDKMYCLPVTEIVSENDFFDFEAKYSGKSQEITPARIPEDLRQSIKERTLKIYQHLNCKGIVRVDYIISEGVPYFLEINTVPGMSSESIVPKQFKEMGIDISDIFDELIQL